MEDSGTGVRPRSSDGVIAVAAYVMLFLAGLTQAVVGSFYYSIGPAPLAALGFDLLVLATCLLGAWGMRTVLGGLLPAVGWFVGALVLSMGTSGGSVLVTNSAAGAVFLFGGSVCAVAGAVAGYVRWSRGSTARRRLAGRGQSAR